MEPDDRNIPDDRPAAPREDREERLAEALRRNLRLRKAQARARRAPESAAGRDDRDGED